MATADEQIRVSKTVKRALESRRRKGESFNDVIERILEGTERDLLAGFGRWSDDHASRIHASRATSKEKSRDRMERLGEDG